MILTLQILGGVVALLLGVWLGMPDRYEKLSEEELDRLFQHGGRTHKVKRHVTPLDWFRKEERGSRRRQGRQAFRTAAPERRRGD